MKRYVPFVLVLSILLGIAVHAHAEDTKKFKATVLPTADTSVKIDRSDTALTASYVAFEDNGIWTLDAKVPMTSDMEEYQLLDGQGRPRTMTFGASRIWASWFEAPSFDFGNAGNDLKLCELFGVARDKCSKTSIDAKLGFSNGIKASDDVVMNPKKVDRVSREKV